MLSVGLPLLLVLLRSVADRSPATSAARPGDGTASGE